VRISIAEIQPFDCFRFNLIEESLKVRSDLPRICPLVYRHNEALRVLQHVANLKWVCFQRSLPNLLRSRSLQFSGTTTRLHCMWPGRRTTLNCRNRNTIACSATTGPYFFVCLPVYRPSCAGLPSGRSGITRPPDRHPLPEHALIPAGHVSVWTGFALRTRRYQSPTTASRYAADCWSTILLP